MTTSNVRFPLLSTYTKPCTSVAPTRQAFGSVLFRKDPRHAPSRVHAAGCKPQANLKRNQPKHYLILGDVMSERSARVLNCLGWPPFIRCPSGACPLMPAGARWCPLVPSGALWYSLVAAGAFAFAFVASCCSGARLLRLAAVDPVPVSCFPAGGHCCLLVPLTLPLSLPAAAPWDHDSCLGFALVCF